MKLAIIGGSSLLHAPIFQEFEPQVVSTEAGSVKVLVGTASGVSLVFVQVSLARTQSILCRIFFRYIP